MYHGIVVRIWWGGAHPAPPFRCSVGNRNIIMKLLIDIHVSSNRERVEIVMTHDAVDVSFCCSSLTLLTDVAVLEAWWESKIRKEGDLVNPATLLRVSEPHKLQLRQAFDMFDSEGVGRIKGNDVKVALYALGYDVSHQEVTRLLHDVGITNEDSMDFNEFFEVLMRKMTARENRIESARAFRQIDQEEKGFISLQDLRAISDSLEMDLTDDELVEMIVFAHPINPHATANNIEFDTKESLVVPEDEFLQLMKRAHVF
eukprot:gene6499-4681_t